MFWGKVEMMGHGLLYGMCEEVTLAGAPMLRVTVPEVVAGPVTILSWSQLVAPAALFRVTELGEEITRELAVTHKAKPVEPWQLSKPLQERVLLLAEVVGPVEEEADTDQPGFDRLRIVRDEDDDLPY